ncbi:MAG TPA: glycosyltransferase [Tepidisphaeraceae bacterium]|jgi:UDP-N-acetylglucosamine transferase subunit ALG13
MIFVTVGTQLPFDRLIQTVERWAIRCGRNDVFAQIAPASAYQPKSIQWGHFLTASDCRRRIEEADLIVSHAGMGTIISGLELGKRLIVMPRRCDLHEHRNNHQFATVARLGGRVAVAVANDADALERSLDEMAVATAADPISKSASPQLLNAIRFFVNSERTNRVEDAEVAVVK